MGILSALPKSIEHPRKFQNDMEEWPKVTFAGRGGGSYSVIATSYTYSLTWGTYHLTYVASNYNAWTCCPAGWSPRSGMKYGVEPSYCRNKKGFNTLSEQINE